MPRSDALFPELAEREQLDDLLTRRLIAATERVARGPVTPDLDPAAFRSELAAFDFDTPHPLPELMDWAIAQLEHGVVHVTSPRYFGLFNPAPTFPAQCADRIAAAFNPQLATATTSPAAVAIEAHVIAAFAARVGLPACATGHFTTGGSEANATALICALTSACDGFATEGSRAFSGRPCLYVSRESHLAWLKIAHQVGIGRDSVRFVPTDGAGRMNPLALASMIGADRAEGCVPVMIAATAGTTNAGMIDPLTACAAIANAERVWLHVDAAWGGAVLASDRLRGVLAGIDRANSVTIDAHKWLAATMGCGMFLTRKHTVLADTFHVDAHYMPSNSVGLDPYVSSLQWSRRFVGLRLFLSLAAAGWRGYARHIERAVELAGQLEAGLTARDWNVVNRSSLAVTCFLPPGDVNAAAIVREVLASGRAWISVARFEGRSVIRACMTHGETQPDDVAGLVAALAAAAARRPAAQSSPIA